MAAMKPNVSLGGILVAAALFAFGAMPTFAQERPSPGAGSGEHAVSRPSGGGGGESSSTPSGGGGSTSSSSGGGSSAGSGGGGGGDHAITRGGERSGRGAAGGHGAARGGGSPRSVVVPSRQSSSEPGDRGTPDPHPGIGAYSRPRGDRPSTGHAVPRDITNVPIPPNWNNDYWNYWYYSYYTPYYQYGYAPCMPYYYGCFYYNPYWWDYYYGYGYSPGYYGGGGGYVSSGDADYETGGLKLKVKPRNAQVYVDGYFSGVVDDFDGMFQKLKLRAGAHRVELRAEGYQPSIFDVLVVAGESVTYRAELKQK
jgi:hypothetical protein